MKDLDKAIHLQLLKGFTLPSLSLIKGYKCVRDGCCHGNTQASIPLWEPQSSLHRWAPCNDRATSAPLTLKAHLLQRN